MVHTYSHLIFVLPGWLKCIYWFLFIPFPFEMWDLRKCVISLDHKTRNENKRNLTYQQHFHAWDIPLSKPSCFSYNHNLKVTKKCFFPKYSNSYLFSLHVCFTATFYTLKKKSIQKFIMHYIDIVIIRRSSPNKYFRV